MKYRLYVIIALIVSSPAFACKFNQQTQAELFAKNKNIFHAIIIKTELVGNGGDDKYTSDYVLATYRKIENFKGEMPEVGTVKDRIYGSGNCSIGIMAGSEYVLMPNDEGFVIMPTGSWYYRSKINIPTQERIKELRVLRDRNNSLYNNSHHSQP